MSGRYATPATEFSDQFGFSDNLGWIVTMLDRRRLRRPEASSALGMTPFLGAPRLFAAPQKRNYRIA